MPGCNIDHGRHNFTEVCNLIGEHIKKNSKIVIFDTFSKSEELFALLYLLLQKISQSYFFAIKANYHIFLLKFKDKNHILNWSQNNMIVRADSSVINSKEFQILSYNYTIKDLSLENLIEIF
ncbi:hypothetical protein COBT_001728 [Conglomerata obtusa]